jgi:hypothetical protein
MIGSRPVYLEQRGESVRASRGAATLAARYLALDHPIDAIHASFPADDAMRAALETGRGMRIIRQPLWECLATFITSSMKQVAHIRAMSLAIRSRFGEAGEVRGVRVHAYPPPERMAGLDEAALRACGLVTGRRICWRPPAWWRRVRQIWRRGRGCRPPSCAADSAGCPAWGRRSRTACCCSATSGWNPCRWTFGSRGSCARCTCADGAT